MARLGMNLGEVKEESNGFGSLPTGEYILRVDSSEIKKTRSGTGFYINFKYAVVSPEEYNRRFVFDIVNIKVNPALMEFLVYLGSRI